MGERRLAQFLRRHAYCRTPARRRAARSLARRPGRPGGRGGVRRQWRTRPQCGGRPGPPRCPDPATLGGDRRCPGRPSRRPASSRACRGVGRVNAAQLLAELGDDRARFPTAEQLTAEAGAARSPARPGSTGPWSFAGRATSASAKPSRRSPITRGMPRRGPPSTPKPGRASVIIPTPSESWPVPGCASSGGAGKIASPTTSTRHRAATL